MNLNIDIDKKILYWIEQFGFKWIDSGELIDYIKKNYIRNGEEIIDEFIWYMEWKVDKKYLNKEKIIEDNNDYDDLGNDMYLNIFLLEQDSLTLQRLDLIE